MKLRRQDKENVEPVEVPPRPIAMTPEEAWAILESVRANEPIGAPMGEIYKAIVVALLDLKGR